MTQSRNKKMAAAAKNNAAEIVEQPAMMDKPASTGPMGAAFDAALGVPEAFAAAPAPATAPPMALNMNDLNRMAAPSPAVAAMPYRVANAPLPQQQQPYYAAAAAPVSYGAAAAASPSAGLSFRATVPPSPAHAASTAMLGSGSHQEMTLPLSEAAPELFGGNPAASTPHYDAIGAAGMAGAAAPMPYQSTAARAMPMGAPASMRYGAAPASVSYGAAAASPSAGISGFRATVPPSPAHAASTAMLGSGSHQEMVLPLSEAAPELFGGNPAASTPHYDAVGAAGIAGGSAPMAAAAPFVSAAAPVTATPMNYATSTPAAFGGAIAAGGVPPSPGAAFRATVPPSPAHAASTAMLGSGSHQEMVLPLSEAAPELFGGNPAASTPHYDAVAAAAAGPGLAAAAPYMGGAMSMGAPAGPAMLPPVVSSAIAPAGRFMPALGQQQAMAGMVTPAFAAPAAAMGGRPAVAGHMPHVAFNSSVPPSPAHAASNAHLEPGSHQDMVLPLSEAAPELFGGNPAASTPHYDAVLEE